MEAAELAKRLKDYVWETLRRSEDYLYKVYI
ncbi:NYN domain-containing protein, partial [Campylobacter coli]|nr:NYN domain-containing protein [Campylobacter coli]